MFPRHIYTFIAAALVFSSNALAQQQAPVKSSPPDGVVGTSADSTSRDADTEDDDGADYDLRILSLKPIAGAARDAFDTLIFTITNAGSDTSHVAKLLVGTKSTSSSKTGASADTSKTHIAARVVIPAIPPGGRVTLRVRVPKLQGDSMCYAGMIELPEKP